MRTGLLVFRGAAAGLVVLALAGAALAQGVVDHGTMHGDHGAAGTADAFPSTAAYIAANDAMHAAMAIEYTGNPDIDFVQGMIGHHQGAIDMARVVIEYGADPEIRRLAEGITAAQEAEIAEMQAWLAENQE
jgi:uncharacterized protein (DUF305 family)